MPTSVYDNLPEILKTVRTRPLFVMRLDVRKLQIVGATPGAYRRVGVVSVGSFEGERLSGEVLDGGNDWQKVRDDGATTLNVRLVLKTKDDALISMAYQGVRHGPPDVLGEPCRRCPSRMSGRSVANGTHRAVDDADVVGPGIDHAIADRK
jgi:Protein of unknown function (DUF3237)